MMRPPDALNRLNYARPPDFCQRASIIFLRVLRIVDSHPRGFLNSRRPQTRTIQNWQNSSIKRKIH
jgi:hypothetical protein